MAPQNHGVCGNCRATVPVQHVKRGGQVFLQKDCPDCGITEALISTDAHDWQQKRDVWHYDEAPRMECLLNCRTCRYSHRPKMVFVDVTNRCNMNCPICIANIPAMGFKFEPPLEYFDKVFKGLAEQGPPRVVQLFGGEPTVRDDLLDIVALARKHGLRVRIVTNGLRLADEEYCKELCKAKVPVLLALDGMREEIYERLRKHPEVLNKKLQALENLKKHSTCKHIIMSCVARKINEHDMGDLIRFIHENRRYIVGMHLIPLTETWEEGEFETDVSTTSADVERIVDAAIPDGKVEFIPAGLPALLTDITKFFGSPILSFGGIHPNCESMTLLFSDGERYRPLSCYTTRGFREFAGEIRGKAMRMERLLGRLEPSRPFERLWGTFLCVGAFGRQFFRFLDWKKIMKGNPWLGILKIAAGVASGRKAKEMLRRHTRLQDVQPMIVLPFEEYHSVEGERLSRCSAGFAYEDPDTGQARTMPVCTWPLYKDKLLRRIADKYASPEPALSASGVPTN